MQKVAHKKILSYINYGRLKAREDFSQEMKNILDEAQAIISEEDIVKK